MTELSAHAASYSPTHKFPSSTSCWKGRHWLRPSQAAPSGTYNENNTVLLKLYSLISSPSHHLAIQENLVGLEVTAMSAPNNRMAYIYRPEDGLNNQRPLRRMANYGRSQPKLDVCVRSGKIETLSKSEPVQC